MLKIRNIKWHTDGSGRPTAVTAQTDYDGVARWAHGEHGVRIDPALSTVDAIAAYKALVLDHVGAAGLPTGGFPDPA